MYPRRYFPRLVLVVGALASIATQPAIEPQQWTLEVREPLAPRALDDTTSMNVRVLTAALTNRNNLSIAGGTLTVQLELRARDASGVRAAEVEIDLASTTPGADLERRRVSIDPGGTATVELIVTAFDGCIGTACNERFELKLRRTALADDPIIDLTGSATLGLVGDGASVPPSSVAIDLDVADLGPVP